MIELHTVRNRTLIPFIIAVILCLSEITIAATDLTDFRQPISHIQGGSLSNTGNYADYLKRLIGANSLERSIIPIVLPGSLSIRCADVIYSSRYPCVILNLRLCTRITHIQGNERYLHFAISLLQAVFESSQRSQ